MQLNDEQAKHAADTLRVVAITQFGFFGYAAGLERRDWWLMVASPLVFIFILGAVKPCHSGRGYQAPWHVFGHHSRHVPRHQDPSLS